jgi:large subunit ribosomal protein L7/L12
VLSVSDGDSDALTSVYFWANYLGGHPARQMSKDGVFVQIDSKGIKLTHNLRELLQVPWENISEILVEGPDEIRRRFTATRLVLFWPAGLAFKKKVKQEYFVVVAGSFGEFILETKAKSKYELQAKLAPWTRLLAARGTRVGVSAPIDQTPSAASDSVASELDRLAELHARGALTAGEFEAAKARVLENDTAVLENDTCDVVLVAAGSAKIQLIKVVMRITGLGLKESKDLVDGVPTPIKEGVPREEAEAIRSWLEEVGATVELRSN